MTLQTFDLRPYQQEAVSAINQSWNEWNRALLVLPTGCGKTVVFNTVAHERPGQTLILAHRDELIEQARDKYEGMFGERPGKIKAQEDDRRRVTVGSVQTMSRRTYGDIFDTVIIDEAHHAVSPSYQKLLTQFETAKVLGVTATPDRGDKKSLAKYFDGIAYEYNLKTAIQEGYLSRISALTIPLEIDMSGVKISVGDFSVDSVAETLEPYLPEIARNIIEYASNRKTVVFCPLISIAQELAQMIPGAKEVNGNSQDRKEILDWFDQAEPGAVLCNAMLLTEGWDCPSCDCVVVLRQTKIRSLYCQMIGRGTRLYPGKENLLILDFLWLCQRHNLCRPASLVSDNDQDVKEVVKAAQKDEIDLLGAVSDAEESRRNALAEALARQKRKKSKLVNPLELFNVLDDIGLANYEPTFKWEEADATTKQIETLNRFGIDGDGITKGYASAILDRVITRSRNNLASVKQVRTLRRFGYDPINWTFDEASKKIGALEAVGWKRWRLHD
jgi:superfamily II DNA or RNA helicase